MLTGGQSSRMGRDKAFVEYHHRALATIAADALRDAGAEDVIAVGGDAAALATLGLDVVADRWPGEGPLGAVITALGALGAEVVVVLACDLPDVTAAAVRAVLNGLDRDLSATVAVPVVEDRRQWSLSGWRRRAALHVLASAFDAGERAMGRAVEPLSVTELTLSVAAWARDADTPGDLFPERGGG